MHVHAERLPTPEHLPPRDDLVLQAYAALAHLSGYYPGFRKWYWDVVVPDLGSTRRLDVVKRGGRIVGICIAKRTDDERKVCTLWISPSHRGTGLGVRMLLDAMGWLETTRPVMTICEERHASFAVLLRRLGFLAPKAVPGLYRQGRIEFVYGT